MKSLCFVDLYLVACRLELTSSSSASGDGANDLVSFSVKLAVAVAVVDILSISSSKISFFEIDKFSFSIQLSGQPSLLHPLIAFGTLLFLTFCFFFGSKNINQKRSK